MAKPNTQDLMIDPATGNMVRDNGKRETKELGLHNLVNAVDDTAAAAAGVPVGGMYRNGSVLQVRVS